MIPKPLKPLNLRFSAAFCFRGQRYGEMMHEWFLNYLSAHRSFPQDRLFSWLWNTDCAHDILNGVKMADAPTKRLLQTMKEKGDLEKVSLASFGIHGLGDGDKSTVGPCWIGNIETFIDKRGLE